MKIHHCALLLAAVVAQTTRPVRTPIRTSVRPAAAPVRTAVAAPIRSAPLYGYPVAPARKVVQRPAVAPARKVIQKPAVKKPEPKKEEPKKEEKPKKEEPKKVDYAELYQLELEAKGKALGRAYRGTKLYESRRSSPDYRDANMFSLMGELTLQQATQIEVNEALQKGGQSQWELASLYNTLDAANSDVFSAWVDYDEPSNSGLLGDIASVWGSTTDVNDAYYELMGAEEEVRKGDMDLDGLQEYYDSLHVTQVWLQADTAGLLADDDNSFGKISTLSNVYAADMDYDSVMRDLNEAEKKYRKDPSKSNRHKLHIKELKAQKESLSRDYYYNKWLGSSKKWLGNFLKFEKDKISEEIANLELAHFRTENFGSPYGTPYSLAAPVPAMPYAVAGPAMPYPTYAPYATPYGYGFP